MAKTFGTDGKGQFSYFAVRLYGEKQEVLQALEKMPIRHYAFIIHDKDTYKESTETHRIGDKKDSHVHIVINLQEKTGWKKVKKMFTDILGEKCGIILSDIKDTENATLYLTHETEQAKKDGKHIYDRSEVVTDNYEYWVSKETKQANKEEKQDSLQLFFNDCMALGYVDKEMYIQYIQQYGRDFIINSRFTLNALEQIWGRKGQALFENQAQNLFDRTILVQIADKVNAEFEYCKLAQKHIDDKTLEKLNRIMYIIKE